MKSTPTILCVLPLILAASSLRAAEAEPPALVSLQQFREVLDEAEVHRADRLVGLDKFLEMSREENTIILDTRSEQAYKRKHLKGAVHLNFSDFTEEKLAKVIPDKTTRILIYCNNNVMKDPINFASKGPPLALNIPTFVNLFGYGYQNIYELGSLVAVDDPRWKFEGTNPN